MGVRTYGAMIPLALLTVSCRPVAVVLLPYLGQLLGSHAVAIPTEAYSPMATRKHPKYLTPPLEFEIKTPYPTTDTLPESVQ